MKRIFSILLTLLMVLSLFGAVSVSAFAEEDEDTAITVIVTGGVGNAINEDGLGYASAAAIRDTYDEDHVLLVDAGGFPTSAAPILSAAGYNLVVPAEVIDGWEITSISMGSEVLRAGAIFDRAEKQIAFIGVAPQGEETEEDYFAAIQKNVDMALDGSMDYIILLGSMDVKAVAAGVTGVDAILTYGDKAEFSEEGVVIGTVAKEFGSIGVLTLDEEDISFENIDKEAYDALELTENEEITALQETWTPEETAPTDEENNAEEGEEVEESDETEEPENVEEAEQTDENEDTEDGEETEQPEENEDAKDGEESEQPEEAEAGEETDPSENDATEPVNDGEPEQTAEPEPNNGSEQGKEPEQTKAPEQSAEPDPTTEPEPTAEPSPAPTSNIISWEKGTTDLVITLQNPIAYIKVSGSELGSQYYVLSSDKKTVSVIASVLNGWYNGKYDFEFNFSDGTSAQTKRIEISGEAPAATPEPTTVPEASTAPAATAIPAAPTAQATTAPRSTNPNTGDTQPVGLYIALLAVLVVALAVVIVLVIRRNKMNKRDS